MLQPNPSQVPLATLLEWLFPGHPARMIKLTRTEDGQKQVVTYPRGARSGDYARHLAIGAIAGPGAIGLFPGYPEKNRGGETQQKSRWLVAWAALDFDGVPLETLHGLIQALWDDGLPCYPTRGTTGRGAHLFFFFMQPLDQPKAVRGLQLLAQRIEALKLPRPELRPSSPYSPGNGILLPYRGADRDGLGANPILDPVSLKPLPLADFNPVHVEAEDWLGILKEEGRGSRVEMLVSPRSGVGRRLALNEAEGSKVESQKRSANDLNATQRWNAELARLTPLWQKGQRQNLILGLSAFGCFLGLPIGKISVDLQAFLHHLGDQDLPERMRGVERTLQKFSQGQRISYRYWYAKSTLEAPTAARAQPPELHSALIRLRQQLNQGSWRGEGGLSDYAVYKTLVETAEQFGQLETPADQPRLSVTLSRRDLLLKSGLASLKTLYKALQRLCERGLVISGAPSRATQAGGFFLPLQACNTHSIPPSPRSSLYMGKKSVTPFDPLKPAPFDELKATPLDPLKPLPPSYPRAAFRRGQGLGKLAERVLDGVLELGGTASIPQLIALLQRPYRQVEKSLTSLNFHQVIDFTNAPDTVTLAPNWQDALLEAAKRTGALAAIARLKARFVKERAERRKAFWRKATRQGVILQELLVLEMGEEPSSASPLGP